MTVKTSTQAYMQIFVLRSVLISFPSHCKENGPTNDIRVFGHMTCLGINKFVAFKNA